MKKNKVDLLKKMCLIQSLFGDEVVFRVGIRNNGRIIDIISADNTFNLKKNPEEALEAAEEIEFKMPVPDYIG
jgi:hypothetical protein